MSRKIDKPRHSEPEENVEEQTALEASAHARNGKVITKADAVRAALAAGKELPGEGVDFIKQRFGIEIAKQHFSAQKSQLRTRVGAPAGKRGPKPRTISKSTSSPNPVANGEMDVLRALEALKPLVAGLGVDRVKRLADILG